MAKEKTRKCYYCDKKGEKTIVVKDRNFYIYKGKGYHKECFSSFLESKNIKKEEKDKIIHDIRITTKETNRKSDEKDALVYWIYDHFKISSLNSYFFKRLDEINEGVYKKCNEPISSKDLLEMYKKQISKMDKYANFKEKKGEGFKDVSIRIVYDLAVLVGKYDSFKAWKEKQKIKTANEEIKNKEVEKYNSLNMNEVFKNRKKKRNDKEDDNELDLNIPIDDLF